MVGNDLVNKERTRSGAGGQTGQTEMVRTCLGWVGGGGAVYGKRDTVRETKEIYGEVRW